jgi:hypothetical protein
MNELYAPRIRLVRINDISKELRSGSFPPVDFQEVCEPQYTDMTTKGLLSGDEDIMIIPKETKKRYNQFSYYGARVAVCFEEIDNDKWVDLEKCYLVVPGKDSAEMQDEWSES